MATKRKTKSKRETTREIPWTRLSSIGLGLLGVGAVVGGIGLADGRAEDLLGRDVSAVRLTWAETTGETGGGTWPPPDVQLRLDRQAHELAAQSSGPLSVNVLERLGEWIVSTGWVAELRSVKRTEPGVITIDAVWRAPAGVVRQNGFDYLISDEGRRLAAQWRSDGVALPVIVGAERMTAATSVLPGEPWPNRPVHAGVELLKLLHAELGVDPILGPGGFDQVWGVDVGEFERSQRLIIITDSGSRIIWGRPPSDPVSDLVPTHQKLKNLSYMRRHPDYGRRIDASQPLIDLSTGPILVDDRPSRPQSPGP